MCVKNSLLACDVGRTVEEGGHWCEKHVLVATTMCLVASIVPSGRCL